MSASRPKHDWTKSYFQAYMILLPFSDTFFYLSSVINPLLYNVSSQQFRRVFWQVLRCHLTLQHANHEKRLRSLASSTTDSARSVRRPLIFIASRSNSSARRTNEVYLSTFQREAEAKSESKTQQLSPESPEPNWETKPADSAAENGFQEHEVWMSSKKVSSANQPSPNENNITLAEQWQNNLFPHQGQEWKLVALGKADAQSSVF